MNLFTLNMLALVLAVGGAAIAGIYLLMLAVPQNDDTQLRDSISEPGHVRSDFLRKFAKFRLRFGKPKPATHQRSKNGKQDEGNPG
jgi:hypothetical protein